MIYVLDTCAAFDIAFQGYNSEKYRKLIDKAERILAPTLYEVEVTNVMIKNIRSQKIDLPNAKIMLTKILQFVDIYTDTAELSIEALHESMRLNHSCYDLFYLILARRNGATLLTLDEKLKRLAIDCGVDVA